MGHVVNIEIPEDQQKFTERPTVVLIHGWTGIWNINQVILSDPELNVVSDAFYQHHDVNVVKVKWSGEGGNLYPFAAAAVPNIAKEVAAFLDAKLGNNSDLWRKLLVAGFSLGAHIAGENSFKLKQHKNITQLFKDLSEKMLRTEKLEQSLVLTPQVFKKNMRRLKNKKKMQFSIQAPQFEQKGSADRLDKTDAEYVECVHTSIDCYGIERPICHSDFYPNEGYEHPGCSGYSFMSLF